MHRKEKDMESKQALRERFEKIIEDAGGDEIDKERMLLVIEKGYRLGYGKGYAAAERNCGAMDENPTSCDKEQPRERS